MCGEQMRLDIREVSEVIPGGVETVTRVRREWVCPECDYFEDVEAGED